jgi:hypothetical protein
MDPEHAAVRPEREVDPHVFRAGVLAFVAFVGVFKDVYALADPGRRGELAWGYLMVRYTSLERVWFGYRLTGDAAWYAALPHVAVYRAVIVGLVGLRSWGWLLAFLYVAYVRSPSGPSCSSTRSAFSPAIPIRPRGRTKNGSSSTSALPSSSPPRRCSGGIVTSSSADRRNPIDGARQPRS